MSERATDGSRKTASNADARRGAVFRDEASRRRRRRLAREEVGGERERERTASASTEVRRDELDQDAKGGGFRGRKPGGAFPDEASSTGLSSSPNLKIGEGETDGEIVRLGT